MSLLQKLIDDNSSNMEQTDTLVNMEKNILVSINEAEMINKNINSLRKFIRKMIDCTYEPTEETFLANAKAMSDFEALCGESTKIDSLSVSYTKSLKNCQDGDARYRGFCAYDIKELKKMCKKIWKKLYEMESDEIAELYIRLENKKYGTIDRYLKHYNKTKNQ